MPQGRILLKSICQSKKLADVRTDGARLLYTWLIPNLDINGCYSGDPEVIRGKVFTRLKKTSKVIGQYLENLAQVGLLVLYEAGGDIFLHIPDFAARQPNLNPEKEAKPTIPMPTPEQLQSNSGLTLLKVKESKEKKRKDYSPEFELFWKKFKGRWIPDDNRHEKGSKWEAFEEWEKLSVEDQRKAWTVADCPRGERVPDGCRWLKNRRFDDFPDRKG